MLFFVPNSSGSLGFSKFMYIVRATKLENLWTYIPANRSLNWENNVKINVGKFTAESGKNESLKFYYFFRIWYTSGWN